jgi:Tfp pilus assembly protein PilF
MLLMLLVFAQVQAFPDTAVAWLAVASYYLMLGRLDAARVYFSKATRLVPHVGSGGSGGASTYESF